VIKGMPEICCREDRRIGCQRLYRDKTREEGEMQIIVISGARKRRVR
jgi:hypothetical protein